MNSPEELLSSKCPVCGAEALAVEHIRDKEKRKSGAVGAPQAAQTIEVTVTILAEAFACGLRRLRKFDDNRWGPWAMAPDHVCAYAQEVALQLRQELNDARARETTDAG